MTDLNPNSVMIEEHGSGYSVTVRFWVPQTHPKLTMQDVFDGFAPMGLAKPDDETFTNESGDLEETEKGSTRRRRANKEAEISDAPDEEQGSPTEDPIDAKPVGRGSRRGRKSTPAPAEETADASPEDKPKGRRGKRSAVVSSDVKTDDAESPTTTAAGASPSEITNEDLTMAAGAAGRVIGGIAVVLLVEELGFEKLQDVPDDRREEVLSALISASEG